MASQSEQVLENKLIEQLVGLGYSKIAIKNENELISNLKTQLEKHNNITLSKTEFERVLNLLSKGSVFDKAKRLRRLKHKVLKDDGDTLYFQFLNTEHWCRNQFQVTHQISMEGDYKNRYDVTLLINGLPLVQIELKRKGLEMKEAFKQINRYQKHTFGVGKALFQYVQLFIISNGVNTKYFTNWGFKQPDFKQTIFWADKENNRLTNILNGFTSAFLEPCHLSKMIAKYIVLNDATKTLMVLRPYQFYAVEAIVNQVKNSTKNGYIWHTTGSGKTLTSFKASQIITKMPQVKKVVFVVDRKDLDTQTKNEFNKFKKGSVDGTDNTKNLVKQFTDETKLIVTTIQKLNTAIKNKRYLSKMEALKDERIVFIFDECHRSQFGDTHNRIKAFFNNNQMFGFTGTPIFAENAVKNDLGKRTTEELFEEPLHKYVITDAIRDQKVLKFAVEYVGRYKQKDSANEIDIEVEDIDTAELMQSTERLDKITDYIIHHYKHKTKGQKFNAMFCVDSVDSLIKYYELFKKKKEEGKHNLKIATIFSYTANEDEKDCNGSIEVDLERIAEPSGKYEVLNKHSREKLDEFILDYNAMFAVNYSTKNSKDFYNYYDHIANSTKEGKVDILLVVNMFLTGFDAPNLNTLFVDKNLKYHGLIQAFSRTNRIKGEIKSEGNIVCFRNLKPATDKAIELFSNKDAISTIIMKPYEDYVEQFNTALQDLLKITPQPEDVNDLQGENDELEFVKAFRQLLRLKNTMASFADFSWGNLEITEEVFDEFTSKYRDLQDKVKADNKKDKASILDDVDFELELIHRDEINVQYILQLLHSIKKEKLEPTKKQKDDLLKLVEGDDTLRSKKELIEKFINDNLPKIKDAETVQKEFEIFWQGEKNKAFSNMVKAEGLNPERTQILIDDYLFAERKPLRDEALNLLEGKMPSILQRRKLGDSIIESIVTFVQTYINGIA